MHRSHPVARSLVVVACLAAAAPAAAKKGAKGRTLMQAAHTLLAQDDYEFAAKQFLEAEEAFLDEEVEIPALLYFDLAKTYDQLGQVVAAVRYYTKFLSASHDEARRYKTTIREAQRAKTRLQTLLDRTALTFEVVPDGTEIRVDRRAVGSTPLAEPIQVKPGLRQITLWKEGYAPASLSVDVGAGATVPVVVTLVPENVANQIANGAVGGGPDGGPEGGAEGGGTQARTDLPPGAGPRPSVDPRIWPSVGLGVAALGGIVGAITLFAIADGRVKDANDLSTGSLRVGQDAGTASDQEIDALYSDGALFRNVAFALAGVGLGAGAVVGYLWLAGDGKTAAAATPDLTVPTLTLTPTAGGAAGALTVSF